jgi:hypothetical protein
MPYSHSDPVFFAPLIAMQLLLLTYVYYGFGAS